MAALNENQWELIARYLSENPEPQDREEANQLAQSSPEFAAALRDAQYYWQAAPKLRPQVQAPNVDQQLEAMRGRLLGQAASPASELAHTQQTTPPPILKPKATRRVALRWAAAVLVMLGVGYLAVTRLAGSGPEIRTVAEVTPGAATEAFQLPDESSVQLHAGRLEWASAEGDAERKVTLHGEAFFDVARDEQKPFIISTKHAQTRVLGTSFLVSEKLESTSIKVSSGKVAFSGTDEAEVLILKEGARANCKDGELQVENRGTYAAFSYQNQPFALIARRLEKAYGINLSFEDEELAEVRITVEFEAKPDQWDQVTGILSKIADVHFEREDGSYLIKANEYE